MRRSIAAAGLAIFLKIVVTASAAAADDSAATPEWRIPYPGTLIGVARSIVVLEAVTPTGSELVTFDANSGQKRATLSRWRADADGGDVQLGGPFLLGSLIGGQLYPSYAGLALVDPATDRLRWRSKGREQAYASSIPGPSRGLIAIATGADIAVLGASVGDEDCRVELWGIQLESGRRRWHWAPRPLCSALFVAAAGAAVVVYSNGRLRALDSLTGRVLWQQASPICAAALCDGLSDFRMAADSEQVAMTIEGRLVVHSTRTGALIAQTSLEPASTDALLVSHGRIYIASGALVCLDLHGRELWRLALGDKLVQMEVGGDVLYVAADGVVRALDRKTGTERWTFGGDRFALIRRGEVMQTVVIGQDGVGAAAYDAHRAPGPAREVTVTGKVTVRADDASSRPPRVQDIRLLVAGNPVHPDAEGKYRTRVRLVGGRIAVSARGCSGNAGPLYLQLDARSEYVQDLELRDDCGD